MKQIILILEDSDGRRTAKIYEALTLEAGIIEFRECVDSWIHQDYTIVEARTV